MTTFKKTTTVTTASRVTKDGKTVTTTETVTTSSDGSPEEIAEVEAAMQESHAAMGKVFEGLDERFRAVFAPLDRLFGRKKTP